MELPNYFKYPRIASYLSDHRVKLGAAVFLKRKPISAGCNQRLKSHRLVSQFREYPQIHAEVAAMLKVRKKELLRGATMVVYREHNRDGNPLMSRPCQSCWAIMQHFGISKVIYTIDNGFAEEHLTNS